MTPILNALPGSREEVYTNRHIQARNCIERCFGLLKSRWRCLHKHRTLPYHPHVASKIVSACCVLHNIMLQAHLSPTVDMAEHHDADDEEAQQTGPTIPSNQEELMQGRLLRDCLVNRLTF